MFATLIISFNRFMLIFLSLKLHVLLVSLSHVDVEFQRAGIALRFIGTCLCSGPSINCNRLDTSEPN